MIRKKMVLDGMLVVSLSAMLLWNNFPSVAIIQILAVIGAAVYLAAASRRR